MYLNLDCRLERGNLFESIAGLLSKTAFPVNTALGSVHLLSLEGLFSILSGLTTGCAPPPLPPPCPLPVLYATNVNQSLPGVHHLIVQLSDKRTAFRPRDSLASA